MARTPRGTGSRSTIASLSTRYQTVAVLPAPNGSDDTTAIQTVLTAAAGKKVVGTPSPTGDYYRISNTLVGPQGGNFVLEMYGCEIRELSGTGKPMFEPWASANSIMAIDAAMTSGSAVLTASTFTRGAGFSAGLVGQAVVVQGAGASGVPLVTTVASYQSSTQVTLAATAGTTVASRYAAVGARDSKIVIRGGLWDRQDNGAASGKGYDKVSLRMRRVDDLRIEDMQWKSTIGKYSVSIGDCTNFHVEHITAVSVISDVVHVNGPASQGVITDILSLYSYDDVVALTAADFNTVGLDTMEDCVGDIDDVTIANVNLLPTAATYSRAINLIAGQSLDTTVQYTLSNIRVTNAKAAGLKYVAQVGDDVQDTRTMGGIYKNIVLDGMTQLNLTQYAVGIGTASGTMSAIEVHNATIPAGSGVTQSVSVSGAGTFSDVTFVGIPTRKLALTATIANLAILSYDPGFGFFTDGNAETMHRDIGLSSTATLTSGTLILSYFRPTRDLLAAGARTFTSGTASGTPTLCRIGIYTVDTSSGDIALVASCASDTALWSGTFAAYDKAFTAAYQLRSGVVYAFGVLFVGTTAPKIAGIASVSGAELLRSASKSQRLAASVAGQSDLPSTVVNATLSTSSGARIYAALRP